MKDIKLKSIELFLFDGMRLGGIRRFKMSPKHDKVVILGTNGAGKSRLMRVIPPHSVNPNDLYDGGHVIHHYIIDGNEVEFKQLKRGKSLKCYITMGDKVIADGTNPTVYNNSVEELFGFDKKTKELLTGRVKFTDMSSSDRKYWFSKLASSDLTTALKYFKVLKEHQRDNNGAIKVTERYVADALPLVLKDKEELEKINTRLEELEVEYDKVNSEWLEHRSKESKMDSSLTELDAIFNKVMGIETEGLNNPGYYQNIISRLESSINYSKTYIVPRLNKEINDLDNKLKETEYYSKNHEVFVRKCEERKAELSKIESNDNLFFTSLINLPLDNLKEIIGDLVTPRRIISVLSKLVSDTKLSELNDLYGALATELEKLLEANARDNLVINNMEEYISRHNHTSEIDCPSCRFSFKPGFSKPTEEAEVLLNNAKERILGRTNEIDRLNKAIQDTHHDIETKKELRNTIQEISGSMSYHPLIHAIRDSGGFTISTNFTVWHDQYVKGAELSIKYCELKEDLKHLENERIISAAASGFDLNDLKVRYETLSDELAKEKEKIEVDTLKLSKMNTMYERAITCDDLETQLNTLLSGIDDTIIDHASVEYTELLAKEKMELWELISSLKERKIRLDKDKAELEYNQHLLENLRSKKLVFDELVKNLSPSDGILAEYIYRGIHSITDSMNLFIEQVFSYPLLVKPCDVDDGELDYTFPFVEGDAETSRPDVSAGSDAQLEIFNSTFVLSSIRALGIVGQPLLLDEPSRYMNQGHKLNYADFVASLYDNHICSQLFVVSHLKEFHSRLGNVDYVVIMEDGIDLPENYNSCVEIEYD